MITYRQLTEEEAQWICKRDGVEYDPKTLHLYKYPDRESVKQLKDQTPFVKVGLP